MMLRSIMMPDVRLWNKNIVPKIDSESDRSIESIAISALILIS